MNGKLTFSDHKFVISVDSHMECYSYIAQSTSWGLTEVKANVKVMVYVLIMY